MNMQKNSNATRADLSGTCRETVLRVLLLCALATAAASAQGTVDERMAADPGARSR